MDRFKKFENMNITVLLDGLEKKLVVKYLIGRVREQEKEEE